MESLTLELDQFLRSVEISKTDFFTTLLGAGASVNSGIKSANDCVWEWKRDIYLTKGATNSQLKLDDRSEQVRQTIQSWINNENGYPIENSLSEYSFYIEKCYPIEDDRRKYFNKICQKRSLL
ncbi:hypothetical protein HK413_01435 [Mucilaginibacter sp. S1162]|uniref:SIR2-like domain-containing protein n=1 Tax=Mucilaginibacter humi TaxID=2732510 RepID=A0ABX1W3K5_9SPHI|nr:hypothetical protein [Mucilaginibacter humi]NNU33166.1 hypothetical protein [Mucilaginibacter humi]